MTIEECKLATLEHIKLVQKYIRFFTDKLTSRGENHDASKLQEPEISGFAEHTENLSKIEYNSEEYKQELEELKETLEHHYAENAHHPEHWLNGLSDMTLWDVTEMFCDWKASTKRQRAGNILKSIDINAERFNIEPQLKQILINTARMMDEQD